MSLPNGDVNTGLPKSSEEELKTEKKSEYQEEDKEEEDVVTPWNVSAASSAGVDYQKLIGFPFFPISIIRANYNRTFSAFRLWKNAPRVCDSPGEFDWDKGTPNAPAWAIFCAQVLFRFHGQNQ
jgi:hypothetical protein